MADVKIRIRKTKVITFLKLCLQLVRFLKYVVPALWKLTKKSSKLMIFQLLSLSDHAIPDADASELRCVRSCNCGQGDNGYGCTHQRGQSAPRRKSATSNAALINRTNASASSSVAIRIPAALFTLFFHRFRFYCSTVLLFHSRYFSLTSLLHYLFASVFHKSHNPLLRPKPLRPSPP